MTRNRCFLVGDGAACSGDTNAWLPSRARSRRTPGPCEPAGRGRGARKGHFASFITIRDAVRRARAMTVSIGFTPGAVGNAEASPIQTPFVSWSSPPPVGDRCRRVAAQAARAHLVCRIGTRVGPDATDVGEERGEVFSPPPGWSRAMRCDDRGSTGQSVHLGEFDMAERCDSLVDGVVKCPLDDGRHRDCRDAPSRTVIVANCMPRRRVREAQHPPLVVRAVEPGAECRPHARAESGALHQVALVVDRTCPVERDNRLHLTLPATNGIVVHSAHEIGRMNAEIRPAAGPPMPERSRSAGDSIPPAATTTIGAATVSRVWLPSGWARSPPRLLHGRDGQPRAGHRTRR